MVKLSDEQVKILNDFQNGGDFHPLTCPNDCEDRVLVATSECFLVCKCGKYEQHTLPMFLFDMIVGANND